MRQALATKCINTRVSAAVPAHAVLKQYTFDNFISWYEHHTKLLKEGEWQQHMLLGLARCLCCDGHSL